MEDDERSLEALLAFRGSTRSLYLYAEQILCTVGGTVRVERLTGMVNAST